MCLGSPSSSLGSTQDQHVSWSTQDTCVHVSVYNVHRHMQLTPDLRHFIVNDKTAVSIFCCNCVNSPRAGIFNYKKYSRRKRRSTATDPNLFV